MEEIWQTINGMGPLASTYLTELEFMRRYSVLAQVFFILTLESSVCSSHVLELHVAVYLIKLIETSHSSLLVLGTLYLSNTIDRPFNARASIFISERTL